jgi:beta-lactamase superfamily II metal-dependent hydrolase
MAGRRRKNVKVQALPLIIMAVIVVIAAIVYFSGFDLNNSAYQPDAAMSTAPVSATQSASFTPTDGQMGVYLIDVGQGDCILLVSPSGKTMLIDAGERGNFDKIDAFLKDKGITRIDALVATHPHSDHIGSMKDVVENYDIGAVYMTNAVHTSATFENLLKAIQDKGLKIKRLKGGTGVTLDWDGAVTINVLSPLRDEYDDYNLYSIVLKVTYGEFSIMLTGDAEKENEDDMLDNFPVEMLDCDILKAGHHGSSTSTSKEFFDAVSPEAVLIPVGEGNDYGHPHEETLETIKSAKVYRSDLNGDISLVTNGQTYEITTEK